MFIVNEGQTLKLLDWLSPLSFKILVHVYWY